MTGAFFGALICVAACAANVGLYVDSGSPWNAASAVFTGLLVFVNLTIMVTNGARR